MTEKDMLARIAELEAQLAKKSQLYLKVSEKGAISVYGLGKYPVSLYATQMTRLLDAEPLIRAFIRDNWDSLAHKEAATTKPASTEVGTRVDVTNTPKVATAKA